MSEENDYFIFKCFQKLEEKHLNTNPTYLERLKYEIQIITQMSFGRYFLIVSDILNWARSQKIPIGPGRGSGAGSLCAYLLGITFLDPIKYKLVFERFLNPDRISMPDFDCDICEDRRDEVVQYIRTKYGEDNVVHIGTFGTLKAKAAIRDVGRALGEDFTLVDKLAKLILPPIEGKPQTLSTCIEKVPLLNKYNNSPELSEGKILKFAKQLEGRIRSYGCHASGILISNEPVYKDIPLYKSRLEEASTQFDMNIVEELGLVKFDFLGLKTLTTIDRALRLIKKRYNQDIDILNLIPDDPETYKLLCEGRTEGVFQLEGSGGIRDLLVQIKPKTLEDISLVIALFRPGPIAGGLVQQVVKVRNGEEQASFYHQDLKSILKETSGVLIYQEQVLEICKQLAGYTMGEADIMRKIVGKKKEKEMIAQEIKFKAGIEKNGYTKELANKLWNEINTFAGYGFNKAHSLCYSFITYQTAYLKANYPIEFMCAALIGDSGNPDKVIDYINDCKSLGIQVLPPDVNHSKDNFSISKEPNTIRFGLNAIKNLGKSPTKKLQQERKKNGPFKSLMNFVQRIDSGVINKKKLESLILSGCFDSIEEEFNRGSKLDGLNKIWEYKEELKRYTAKKITYDKKIVAYRERLNEIEQGLKKKSFISPTEPVKPEVPKLESCKDVSFENKLAAERELLGLYLSGHPLDLVANQELYDVLSIKNIFEEENYVGRDIKFLGVASTIKEITTKAKKEKMAFLKIEDRSSSIEATIFAKTFARISELLSTTKPLLYIAKVEKVDSESVYIPKLIIKEIRQVPLIQTENIEWELDAIKLKEKLDNIKRIQTPEKILLKLKYLNIEMSTKQGE